MNDDYFSRTDLHNKKDTDVFNTLNLKSGIIFLLCPTVGNFFKILITFMRINDKKSRLG